MSAVPLREAQGESSYGGKAVSLGAAIRAGLPVPPGVALSVAAVEAMAREPGAALNVVGSLPSGRLAVRSSAVGEDSGGASFAGQHATCLNVRAQGVAAAVRRVRESARTPAALAYRARRNIAGEPRIAAVIQVMIDPRAAGVLFTRDPVTFADEIVIEASWGLGESVVNGLVTPDRYRLDRRGLLLEQALGEKDLQMSSSHDGDGTIEEEVPSELHGVACLSGAQVERLIELVDRCRGVFGDALDLEWAFAKGSDDLFLLQCRPITTVPSAFS